MCIIHTIDAVNEMNSKDLLKLLEQDGWYIDRIVGSHHILKHPEKPGHISLPHPKKDLGKGIVQKLKKAAGI